MLSVLDLVRVSVLLGFCRVCAVLIQKGAPGTTAALAEFLLLSFWSAEFLMLIFRRCICASYHVYFCMLPAVILHLWTKNKGCRSPHRVERPLRQEGAPVRGQLRRRKGRGLLRAQLPRHELVSAGR